MNDIIKLGPFLLKYNLLVIIIAGFIGYLFMILKFKKTNVDKRLITDILSGTILLGIIVWKFGDVLFNPSLIWRNPLFILYLNGTEKTLILAIISSVLYLSYKIMKNKIPIYTFLDLLPFGLLPFLFVYNLAVPSYGYKTNLPWGISISTTTLKYHPVNIYFAAIIVCLFIFIWRIKDKMGSGVYLNRTVSALGVSGLLLTFLAPQKIAFLGLSALQSFYIFLLLIGFLPRKKQNRLNGETS